MSVQWKKNEWKGDVPILYEKVTLTSAEILALNATPKELVPAPGVGRVIEFISAALFLDYGTIDYATYGDLTANLHTSGTALSDSVAAAALVQGSADTYSHMQALSAEAALSDNEALELRCATGEPTAGDSIIVVHVAYRIHDFS